MDLEDHMAVQASDKHSPFLELNGKKIHKAKVLKEFFKYSTSPGSTDRLKRVAGLSRFSISNIGSPSTVASGHDDSILGDNCLCIGDPAVTLMRCSNHIFLSVIHITQILSDSCLTFRIPIDMLVEPIVEVQFQILCLTELTPNPQSTGEDSGLHDWTWSGRYIETPGKTKGTFIQPISPHISTKTLGKPTYLFKTSELCALALSLFTSIPRDQHSYLPLVKQRDSFPYRTSGKAAFVCEFDGSVNPSAAEADICPKCNPPFVWDRMKPLKVIEHIGAHILFDQTIDKAEEYCGLCFRLSPLCLFHFRKGKNHNSMPQIDTRRSRCPNLNEKAFSYGPASISSANSPCTNVPMRCPRCPESASLVWKYSMAAHYTKCHPLANFADGMAGDVVIGQAERAGLNVIWANRHAKKRSRRDPGHGVPLQVSDTHRARVPFA